MTTTSIRTTSLDTVRAAADARTGRPILRAGLVAAVAASAVNLAFAAGARAADVSLQVPDGEHRIPVYAFAQMTLIWAVVGIGFAAALRRWSAAPRRNFVAITVALTALSMVPPFTVDADLATELVLCATHAFAAAIVIPVVAARLPRTRPVLSRSVAQ